MKKGGNVSLFTSGTSARLEDQSNGEAGVLISIDISPNEIANYGVEQIVDHNNLRKRIASDQTWAFWILTGENYRLLDTLDFLPLTESQGTVFTQDSPNSGPIYYSNDEVIAEQSFTDYLMYKPPGGKGTESIWVPISAVSWNWAGHATRAGDNWDPSDLVSHTNPVDANGSSTTTYPGHAPYTGGPGWTKNIKLDGYWDAEITQ